MNNLQLNIFMPHEIQKTLINNFVSPYERFKFTGTQNPNFVYLETQFLNILGMEG